MTIKSKLPLPLLALIAVVALIGVTFFAAPRSTPAAPEVAALQWQASGFRVVENLEPTILALVTNTSDTTSSGSFVLFVSDGSGLVAKATAAAMDVAPGDSVLLTFLPQEVHGVLADVNYTYRLESKY